MKHGDGRSPKKTELWLAGNILGFYINMGDFPAMEPMTPDSKYEIIGYSTIFYYDTVGS